MFKRRKLQLDTDRNLRRHGSGGGDCDVLPQDNDNAGIDRHASAANIYEYAGASTASVYEYPGTSTASVYEYPGTSTASAYEYVGTSTARALPSFVRRRMPGPECERL